MKCDECDRLWKLYEESVFGHVRQSGRLKLAEASGDSAAIVKLAREVELGALRRSAARAALTEHESTTGHGESIK